MESLPFGEDREVLRPLMGCAVHFSSIEQSHIVLTAQVTHQVVEIKHWGNNAFEFVFGWHDDIEIVPGRHNSVFGHQPCEVSLKGDWRHVGKGGAQIVFGEDIMSSHRHRLNPFRYAFRLLHFLDF